MTTIYDDGDTRSESGTGMICGIAGPTPKVSLASGDLADSIVRAHDRAIESGIAEERQTIVRLREMLTDRIVWQSTGTDALAEARWLQLDMWRHDGVNTCLEQVEVDMPSRFPADDSDYPGYAVCHGCGGPDDGHYPACAEYAEQR